MDRKINKCFVFNLSAKPVIFTAIVVIIILRSQSENRTRTVIKIMK